MGARNILALHRLLAASAALALSLLVCVHLAFVSPFTQLSSANTLSRAVVEAGGWHHARCGSELFASSQSEEDWSRTIVRLEVVNSSWPRHWTLWGPLLDYFSLEEPALENLSEAPVSQELQVTAVLARRLVDLWSWSYDLAFPAPCYEVSLGSSSAAWLEVQSPKMRTLLGVRTVHLQVSARDPEFFGPSWAREVLSMFRLYNLYVFHALPLDFIEASACRAPAPKLYVLAVNSQRDVTDLTPILESVARAKSHGWSRWLLWRTLAACFVLPIGAASGVLLSALVRRLLVLSCRMRIYNSLTVWQMQRYAFIAEPLRRVNCYSSTELLELWAAWSACVVLLVWLLLEALQLSAASICWILCFVEAEYWGLVHVRTVQSRWLFPRCTLLIHAAGLVYVCWWPLGPRWLLLWSLASAQFLLQFVLLCRFDCCFALPMQPPHQLMARSLLMPAMKLSRSPRERPAEPLRLP
ncbi:unnamed protein product, partial [Polarella glacialis]